MAEEKSFNEKLIDEFRANGGKVGGVFAGRPMMLLTTTGKKSGEPRVAPLVYSTDGDDVVVIASKGGAPTNPDWYYNLLTNSTVTAEVGTETYQAEALVVSGEERQRLYDAQATEMPMFAEYQKNTEREIPVIVLKRLGASAT